MPLARFLTFLILLVIHHKSFFLRKYNTAQKYHLIPKKILMLYHYLKTLYAVVLPFKLKQMFYRINMLNTVNMFMLYRALVKWFWAQIPLK